jgi:glycosyltransferase involved in cell wall biosynthesis
MINITYLIPVDSISGGVEVAVKNVRDISNNKYQLNIEYIFKNKSDVYSFSKLVKSIKKIVLIKPDVLIISLWRSQVVGIFVKFFRPSTKLIFFIHSEADVHFVDFLSSRIALFLSTEVWADSIASLNQRFKYSKKIKKGRVVSFDSRIITRLEIKSVEPKFIFWGRVGREKAVTRSIIIFSKILKFYPKATFKIIGSDGGQLAEVKRLCEDLKINNSVFFYNESIFSEIMQHAQDSCFYLQTSIYEGAAMSVMESMKLGLVPVVTTVGEISRYCNGNNAIIIKSNDEAVRDILMLLESPESYYKLSDNAFKHWENHKSYKESFKECCEGILYDWF